MFKKQQLGQFYTSNSKHITCNLLDIFNANDVIVDPFAGNNDLINLLPNHKTLSFDIDPQNDNIIKNDSILNPIDYTDKWIFTNPPYLSRNKNKDKSLYNKFHLDDLYKIAVKTIIGCKGGILILPINFFSSTDNTIRSLFLKNYIVKRVNVFETPVFDDTTYNICSFSFIKQENDEQNISFFFYPSNKTLTIEMKEPYIIGNEIYNLEQSHIKVSRLLIDEEPSSYMFLNAIDRRDDLISLSYNEEPYYGKKTDRVFATISFNTHLTKQHQLDIIKLFNEKLNYYRDKYNSLFLPNYRDNNRKRIPFKLAYILISNSLKEILWR